jgi:hypothetical protein
MYINLAKYLCLSAEANVTTSSRYSSGAKERSGMTI